MRIFVLGCLAALAVSTVGCGTPDARLKDLAREFRQLHGSERYVVEAPDVLAVEVRPNAELNTQVTVRPDGYITLQYIDDVYVEGMTCDKIDQVLTERYREYIKGVEVTVTLITSRSKNIYVLGEVNRPGVVPYVGKTSVMDAVTFSGGLTRNAQPEVVKIVRMDIDEPVIHQVDLKDVVYRGKAASNFQLQAGDIVFVEATALAKMGYAVDALLFPARAAFLGLETSSSARFTLRNYGRSGLGR